LHLESKGLSVVLVGGAVVSIYSEGNGGLRHFFKEWIDEVYDTN
jgi:hypothetical protein